jgi:nitrogen regulatory protein PII
MKPTTTTPRPFNLEVVRNAVTDVGVQGVSVTEAGSSGRQRGHTGINGGARHAVWCRTGEYGASTLQENDR